MTKFNLFFVVTALSLSAGSQAMELWLPDIAKAAAKGDHAEVKRLITSGAHVNSAGKWGSTALMKAAENGHLEIVKTLIIAGADVNQQNINGWTALMVAIGHSQSEIAKVLIDAKTNLNLADTENGKNPLIFAAQKGLNYIVQELINKGAKIDQAEKGGTVTALWVAQYNDHEKTAQILIAAGADKRKGYKSFRLE